MRRQPFTIGTIGTRREPQNEKWIRRFGKDAEPDEARFCSCILDVLVRNDPDCNLDNAWKQGYGYRCSNPWAVCTASLGYQARGCSEMYDFESLTDDELLAYAEGKRLPLPQPYNRQRLLATVHSYAKGREKLNLGQVGAKLNIRGRR